MMPGTVSKRVLTDRLSWIENMVAKIRSLPLADKGEFLADYRNVATAESCLRRALEALFDAGRHVLAKGFGSGVSEYKEIAVQLKTHSVLSDSESKLLITLAGYRNRLVHFYHEVEPGELHEICAKRLGDVERVAAAYRTWISNNPDRVDSTL